MKRVAVPVIVALILGTFGSALGQTVEMAAKCEEAHKQLGEMVKKPDFKDVKQVKRSLGADVLDTCDGSKGKITCFQCIDKSGLLRTLQIRLDKGTGKYEFLGYGCECRSGK